MESQPRSVYHAVYVPLEDDPADANDTQLHVYCDKTEALKVIKEHKKGRLKSFKTIEEAKEFARNGLESVLPNPLANSVSNNVGEESKFKVPRPQALTSFRKVIEIGDLDAVRKIIWENPKYLVSSADTPTIMHIGSWYNALHIAVKVTQSSEMCRLILDTVGDPEFVRLLYGNGCESRSYVNRGSILQDLYLNTPDKGLNETPLHFATKFGLKECVRTLLLYPQCSTKPLNKYHQTPGEIICSRKSSEDLSLIIEIRSLLQEQYYVPVLRAEDNSLQPTIGELFSPTSPPIVNNDPMSPKVEVRAFAGPMSKEKAVEFRRKWKTPPRTLGTPNKKANFSGECNGLRSPNLNLSLRLQDTDKGLERVGRELATEYQVAWKEYWPFLKDFVDLRCVEGLNKFEEYLKKRFLEKVENLTGLEKSFKKLFEMDKVKHEINLNDFCKHFQALALEPQKSSDQEVEDDSEFITPPSSPLRVHTNESNESSDEDEMDLADDSINEELFLEGKTPTKIDFAVLTAIPSTIDVNKYPHTYRWRHEMLLASKNVNNSIRSPRNLPFKRRLFLSDK